VVSALRPSGARLASGFAPFGRLPRLRVGLCALRALALRRSGACLAWVGFALFGRTFVGFVTVVLDFASSSTVSLRRNGWKLWVCDEFLGCAPLWLPPSFPYLRWPLPLRLILPPLRSAPPVLLRGRLLLFPLSYLILRIFLLLLPMLPCGLWKLLWLMFLILFLVLAVLLSVRLFSPVFGGPLGILSLAGLAPSSSLFRPRLMPRLGTTRSSTSSLGPTLLSLLALGPSSPSPGSLRPLTSPSRSAPRPGGS